MTESKKKKIEVLNENQDSDATAKQLQLSNNNENAINLAINPNEEHKKLELLDVRLAERITGFKPKPIIWHPLKNKFSSSFIKTNTNCLISLPFNDTISHQSNPITKELMNKTLNEILQTNKPIHQQESSKIFRTTSFKELKDPQSAENTKMPVRTQTSIHMYTVHESIKRYGS